MFKLVPRAKPSLLASALTPVLAFVITIFIGFLLLTALGFDAASVLYNFFVLSLNGTYELSELFVKATPLVLIGVGLSFGYRAGVWNIGAEGQFIIGAVVGGALALQLADLSIWLALPIAILASAVGGMAWAAIPAFLRTKMNTSELLTSLMLVYVAQQVLFYLVAGPMKDKFAFSWPKSPDFGENVLMPIIIEGTRFHLGWFLAFGIAILAAYALYYTLIGFQIRVAGEAPRAARYASFTENKVVWMCLLFGGACAGMAGYMEAANNVGHLSSSVAANYGFTAIIVAFLGRLNPIGIVFAGLVLALTFVGGETVQTFNRVPQGLTMVLQTLLLFLVLASDILIKNKVVWQARQKSDGGAAS